jgi:hypothetical protein
MENMTDHTKLPMVTAIKIAMCPDLIDLSPQKYAKLTTLANIMISSDITLFTMLGCLKRPTYPIPKSMPLRTKILSPLITFHTHICKAHVADRSIHPCVGQAQH